MRDDVNPVGRLDGGDAGGRVLAEWVQVPAGSSWAGLVDHVCALEAIADAARAVVAGVSGPLILYGLEQTSVAWAPIVALADALDALDKEE